MRESIAWTLVVAAFFVAGCSHSNNSGLSGVSSEKADKINSARDPFEKSEDPPITAETHFAAAQLAESQGEFAAAVKQYKEALKLDDKHTKSLYRLAICYSQLKKFPDAVAAWKKYIESTDNDANGYSNLGFCHELAGDIDHAEAAYLRGIEKDPKNVPCLTNYGLMLARIGRTAEATLQLQAVLPTADVH
jgi:tetratricopeptide (TPR) repeat protein